jgi:hypothetical protein
MAPILLLIFPIALLIALYFPFKFLLKKINRKSTVFQYCCFLAFVISLFVFLDQLTLAGEYYQSIDVVDEVYKPLAGKYIITPSVFFMLSVMSIVLLWIRGRRMPPLLFVFAQVFLIIGIIISFTTLLQVAANTEDLSGAVFLFLPIVHMLISFLLIFPAVEDAAEQASNKHYHSKVLKFLNKLLANVYLQPVWVLLLLFPVFVLVTLILTLFGQDTHAITKVFTDTATWNFSQKEHAPILGHNGHYLCTVAARGHLHIVRPLRYGKRHGKIIIVNRQLLIANAFEQFLEENFSSLHRCVRKIYDKYGYPLSRHITKPIYSDVIYLLMKPVEYLFVIVLYLCCNKPEEKIARQYE